MDRTGLLQHERPSLAGDGGQGFKRQDVPVPRRAQHLAPISAARAAGSSDTGAILLDKTPDRNLVAKIRAKIESDGDRLNDLHLWRLGPGHLGAIVSVTTNKTRGLDFYRARLGRFGSLSHLTIEIQSAAA